jgi:hypothetical protein
MTNSAKQQPLALSGSRGEWPVKVDKALVERAGAKKWHAAL